MIITKNKKEDKLIKEYFYILNGLHLIKSLHAI